MPYGLRDQQSSSFFHVYSRGADRQDIFCLDGDHGAFEALVAEMARKFNVEIHAFAWMSNHFHLLLHAPDGNLSEAMQFLLGTYARRFNFRTQRSGPVFDRRFGSVPIVGDEHRSSEAHFVIAARYIHRNPLAFVPPAALATFAQSSLGVYLASAEAPGWLTTRLLGDMIDPNRYLDELLETVVDDLLPIADLPPAVVVSIAELDAVASVLAERGSLATSDARLLSMTLAIELRIGALDSVSEYFGVAMDSVRRSARRGRVRLVADRSFWQFRALALARLAEEHQARMAAVRFHPEEKRTREKRTGEGAGQRAA